MLSTHLIHWPYSIIFTSFSDLFRKFKMNPNLTVGIIVIVAFLGTATGANYCPDGERICANEIYTNCYNPNTQNCWAGIPCLKALKGCSGKCYDPNEKFCAGSEICDKNMSTCYFRCYDPKDKTKKCIKHEYGELLCGANQKVCSDEWGLKVCC